MSDSTDILNDSLAELIKRREGCKAALLKWENAITSLQGVIDDLEGNENSPKVAPEVAEPTEDTEKKVSRRVTEADVREAIMTLVAEPFPPLPPPHTLEDGYFTISQVCDVMGLSSIPNSVRNTIAKFIDKGMLEGQPYKNGNQFRYVRPQETGAGAAALVQRPISESEPANGSAENGRGVSVPGTGDSGIRAQNKDVQKMISAARAQGISVSKRGSGHLFVQNSRNGKSTTVSTTANTPGLIRQIRSDLISVGVSL